MIGMNSYAIKSKLRYELANYKVKANLTHNAFQYLIQGLANTIEENNKKIEKDLRKAS